MKLLALLACLLIQRAYPARDRQPLMSFYGRMCLSAAKRLDAGDRNSGILAWFALMAAILVPVTLVAALASAIHPVVLWVLNVTVLYATLRFLAVTGHLAAIEAALRSGDLAAATNRLAQWSGEPNEAQDGGMLARRAAGHALREAHHGAFAPIFWFLVLPGPVGLVLHPLARRAARTWDRGADSVERDFGWFASRAFHVIDWVPQRLSGFTFAVVGNFEDALYCWRSQAAQWSRPEEGIVLASGAGALGVRLAEPSAVDEAAGHPGLGSGEPAREDALVSLEGLLWRALILWLIVYLLAAALHLA